MSSPPTIHDLFAALQAETEESWLNQVFVSPSQRADFIQSRSTAIIGSSGSGKTALRLMLLEQSFADRLVVRWLPALPHDTGQQTTTTLVNDLLQTIARELIKALGREPSRFDTAEDWAQEELATIIYMLFDKTAGINRLVGRLSSGLAQRGRELVAQLLLPSQPPETYSDTRPQQLIEDLVVSLPQVGYTRVWVVVDGLERLEAQEEIGRHAVESLCAVLSLFELPGLSFKILVPDSFVVVVRQSRSFHRRRLVIAQLQWSEGELMQLVERRLAILLGRSEARVEEIAPVDALLEQLRIHEPTPRAWIEAFRPFVEAFFLHGAAVPLTAETFTLLIRPTTPQLRISGDQILINGRDVSPISPQSRQILDYLFARRGLTCTRAEIYYCALRGKPTALKKGEIGYEDPARWRSTVDTALNRLREAIEPNPKQPVLLITKRGEGIMLV